MSIQISLDFGHRSCDERMAQAPKRNASPSGRSHSRPRPGTQRWPASRPNERAARTRAPVFGPDGSKLRRPPARTTPLVSFGPWSTTPTPALGADGALPANRRALDGQTRPTAHRPMTRVEPETTPLTGRAVSQPSPRPQPGEARRGDRAGRRAAQRHRRTRRHYHATCLRPLSRGARWSQPSPPSPYPAGWSLVCCRAAGPTLAEAAGPRIRLAPLRPPPAS